MKRREFIGVTGGGLLAALPSVSLSQENASDLIQGITQSTISRNRDGKSTTWFHPRACMMPGTDGDLVALMTKQAIAGSDYFGPVHSCESRDLGKTWTDPTPIPALGRAAMPKKYEGLQAGVCDVVPQYHPKSNTVLGLGHVVFYRGKHFDRKEQLARYPVYAVRKADGTWSERKKLEWDDPRGAFIYTNNCGQRVNLPNGDILMSFTFGPKAANREVCGVQCSFDGETLRVKEVGPALKNPKGRGLLEPSITRFKNRIYLTMRAEDSHGYVSVSDDGLSYAEKKPWVWDDGSPIAMSTTQQHWLTHSDGLFLVYTRKDKSNTGVIRWRSPLWVAKVDPVKLHLIRSTERIVLPLVGDGVKEPDSVALMGNFNITNAGPNESWVTVGEWIPRRGARGDLMLARIAWSKPNLLVHEW